MVVATRRLGLLALIVTLLLGPSRAEDDIVVDPVPLEDPEARAAFDKALRYQERGQWWRAKRAFQKFMEEFPDSPLVAQAALRGGDNAYLGTTKLAMGRRRRGDDPHGPIENRIDVAVMGDGFTLDRSDQAMQERWAQLCLEVLFNEKAFGEYQDYFNFYFVRLGSLEEGVDPNLSPEELKKAQERNRRRRRDINHKIDYSTALNCKAAGPQGQVMADRGLVYKWLGVANEDVPGVGHDRFVIAFARFGKLGMGGGGIANVGRPDKSVTTHEFGHAFSRLLDEYAVNPNPPHPMRAKWLKSANAFASMEEPEPEEVPWAHMLKARVKGVGIYEGGATHKKGVWKPARTCAMNIGGNQFCPVCREQTILVIYEYVSPIDEVEPDPAREVTAREDGDARLVVTPMEPKRHRLEVTWYVAPRAAETEAGVEGGTDDPAAPDDGSGDPALDHIFGDEGAGGARRSNPFRGHRGMGKREEYAKPPRGEESKLGKRKRGRRGDPTRHYFPLGKLSPGRYTITVEVRDDTDWVLKDPKHLLVERATWTVTILPEED